MLQRGTRRSWQTKGQCLQLCRQVWAAVPTADKPQGHGVRQSDERYKDNLMSLLLTCLYCWSEVTTTTQTSSLSPQHKIERSPRVTLFLVIFEADKEGL